LFDAWLCVIAISDYPHFVANACTGSRFLRRWHEAQPSPSADASVVAALLEEPVPHLASQK
jgi:hypothetical protein